MHQVHFLEVFHAGCYLRGHVDQRAETATGRTRGEFQKFCTMKRVCVCMRVWRVHTKTYRLAANDDGLEIRTYGSAICIRVDGVDGVSLLSSEGSSWWKLDDGCSNGFFLMVCTMILRFSSIGICNKICNNENCSSWKKVLESCIPLFSKRRLLFLIQSILYSMKLLLNIIII